MRTEFERFELIAGNIIGMLRYRGYKVDPEMKIRTEDDLGRVYHLDEKVKVDLPKQITVFYTKEDKGVNIIKKLIVLMDSMKVKNAIFVTPEKLTGSGATALRDSKGTHKIQHFLEAEFLVSRIRGLDTPKYTLLTKEEGAQRLRESEKDPRKLRQIVRADPQAKYWGAKPGSVFKVVYGAEVFYQYLR